MHTAATVVLNVVVQIGKSGHQTVANLGETRISDVRSRQTLSYNLPQLVH